MAQKCLRAWVGLAFGIALAGCGRSTEWVQLDRITSRDARAIQNALRTGGPIFSILEDRNGLLPGSPNSRDSKDEDDCGDFVRTLPKNFQRGFVYVPEDETKPRGRKVKIFYYGRIEEGKSPVVFFNGGPASSSHSSYQILEPLEEVAKHSFIYIDQRGTGCSEAFPDELVAESVERLENYGTRSIVRDSEAVRKKLLGNEGRWKIFGQSYGGLIVHRYVMTAPQYVDAALAHGMALMSNPNEWLALRLLSQKRVMEDYFEKYPTDRDLLSDARKLISDDLCFTDGDTSVCGPSVLDALTILLGFQTSWERMHTHLEGLIRPNGSLNRHELERVARTLAFGVYAHNAFAAGVIGMIEMTAGQTDAQACLGAVDWLKSQLGESPENWILNECRVLTGIKNPKWTELWKLVKRVDQPKLTDLRDSLTAYPDLPFYFYAGEKDVFVPVEVYAEQRRTLGARATYREFPLSGHEGFYTEAQVWADLASPKASSSAERAF